jgi:hypothetical protein
LVRVVIGDHVWNMVGGEVAEKVLVLGSKRSAVPFPITKAFPLPNVVAGKSDRGCVIDPTMVHVLAVGS